MRIEHIAIWVKDLELSKTFYTQYFGLKANELYENKSKGFTSYFLSSEEGGARLEIMHSIHISTDAPADKHLGFTHIALSVGGKDEVDKLSDQLRKDGYTVVGEPRTTGDGYYESVIADPDGNLIEITE
ncbi:VOC family protein [Carboxylicivirga sp. RSCT41]|uniref:VOC family protein n=1 Tax=Carboxylicivirga agarovorans TaxID=3417570 RepID=UPI003D337A22